MSLALESVHIILLLTIERPTSASLSGWFASLPRVDAHVLGCAALAEGPDGLSASVAQEVRTITANRATNGQSCVVVPLTANAEPWNEVFHAARALASERGWHFDRTYVIRLRPHQSLHQAPRFDPSSLVADGYELRCESAAMRRHALALVSLALDWQGSEVSDELWEPREGCCRVERHEQVWIEEGSNEDSTYEQLEHRLGVLRAFSASNSGNPRWVRCLGQTLLQLGAFREASAAFSQLGELGISAQQRWYANLHQGTCLLYSGSTDEAVSILSAANLERPDRAEPLVALARHHRAQGDVPRAFDLACRGLGCQLPAVDEFWVDKSVYTSQLWEEVMLSAYYVGEVEFGLAACERLLERRDTSGDYQEYVTGNERFYARKLQGQRRGHFAIPEPIRRDSTCTYACSNPTVTAFEGRTVANVRLVNYRQEFGRYYASTASDGVIRTRNVSLDRDPHSRCWYGERESCVDLPVTWPQDVPVRGVEDMRWVTHRGRVWFTATCCHVPGYSPMPQVVLGRLNAQLDRIDHLVHLRYSSAGPVEKNWMPWSHEGTLYLIYSYDPFVVLHVDPETGWTTSASLSVPQWNATRFRGSTPPVPIPGSSNWAALVHEVIHLPSGREYLHRFVEMSPEFTLVRRSAPFFFDHLGIEYAAGMCACGFDHVLIAYGWEDREARWIEVGWDQILLALGPTRHPGLTA